MYGLKNRWNTCIVKNKTHCTELWCCERRIKTTTDPRTISRISLWASTWQVVGRKTDKLQPEKANFYLGVHVRYKIKAKFPTCSKKMLFKISNLPRANPTELTFKSNFFLYALYNSAFNVKNWSNTVECSHRRRVRKDFTWAHIVYIWQLENLNEYTNFNKNFGNISSNLVSINKSSTELTHEKNKY